MTFVSVGEVLDRIVEYDSIFRQFNYTETGIGERTWSSRAEHPDGSVIDFRASDWTYTGPLGKHEGRSPQELKALLLTGLSRDELIALIMEKHSA